MINLGGQKTLKPILTAILALVLAAGTSLMTTQTAVAFDDDKGTDEYIYFAKIDENGELINGATFRFYGSDGKGIRDGLDTYDERTTTQNTRNKPPAEYTLMPDISLQPYYQYFGVQEPSGSFDGYAQYRDFDEYIIMEEINTPDKYAQAAPVTISYAGSTSPDTPYLNYSLTITGEAYSKTISDIETYYRLAECLSEDPGKAAETAFKQKYANNSKNWPDFLIVDYPKVKIAKKDTNGMYLKGATLEITGTTASGHPIEKKTITSTEETMILGLPSGTYTLHEEEAPEGYAKATDIEFTVDDGVITVNGEVVDEVVMTDEKEYEPKPLLSVRKTSDVKTARPGDVIPYVITVTNKGDADADDVIVLDTMGDNLSYVSDDSGGVVEGQKVSWNVKVPAGGSKEIKIDCRINESAIGKVINDVRITNVEEEFLEPEGEDDSVELVLDESTDKVAELEETEKTGKTDDSDRTTSTGDGMNMLVLLVFMIAAGGTLGTLAFRRRQENR